MEYIKRTLNILLLPFKLLLKAIAIICYFLLAAVHFSIVAVSALPIFILQVIEWLTVYPIYYIITGKKYNEKYNRIFDMIFDLLLIERPYYIKDNMPPKHKPFHMYGYDKYNDENQDLYTRFWGKIMKISLKLKYD